MINKPLLEKETLNHYKEDNKDSIIYLKYNDVVEALKKFQEGEMFDFSNNKHYPKCKYCNKKIYVFGYVLTNKLDWNKYHKDCWFEECFGKLPKIKKEEQK